MGSRTPQVSPTKVSGSSSCHLNPHRCFQSEVLRLYFPALEPWVAWSVLYPISSSRFTCLEMWDCPLHQLPPCLVHQPPPVHPGPPAATLLRVLSTRLPISAPPISLDEYFFFNSLVTRLPYSLIFCRFWLFFVFKLLLSLFWLCEEAQLSLIHI